MKVKINEIEWTVAEEVPTPEELIESARKANEVIERSRAAQRPQTRVYGSPDDAYCAPAICTPARRPMTGRDIRDDGHGVSAGAVVFYGGIGVCVILGILNLLGII